MAALHFDLQSFDGRYEFKRATEGSRCFRALWEFDQKLRAMTKYEEDGHADRFRKVFHEILDEHGVRLDSE